MPALFTFIIDRLRKSGANLCMGARDYEAIAAPKGAVTWDIDPYSEDVLADPIPYYDELRARGPLVYLSRYGILASGRYKETRAIFSDWPRFVSSRGVGLSDFSHTTPWRAPSIILEVDPPAHRRTRGALAKILSPSVVEGLRVRFQAAADELIPLLADRGRIDAVEELAESFPLRVFPQALGLKAVDRARLLGYGAIVFNALGPDNALRRQSMAQAPDIVPWILEQCRRENLEANGFGAALYTCVDRGELIADEAAMLVRSLLSAGIDTTVSGIGGALLLLANHQEIFARLRADPSLARSVIDESLRLTSPVHSFCRTAQVDTDVAGIAIPAGTKVLCVLGAANRDPSQWPEPERFDPSRKTVGHLAFGIGVHACVGQLITRAEGEAVLKALAAHVNLLQLDGPVRWRPGNSIRTLDSLPLILRRH
jgi:4-methoxybenzoate monooxygenase (O-demethylating)